MKYKLLLCGLWIIILSSFGFGLISQTDHDYHYTFDNNFNDDIGSKHMSTAAGDPALSGTSKVGNGSIYFDGNDKVAVGGGGFPNLQTTGTATISQWIYPVTNHNYFVQLNDQNQIYYFLYNTNTFAIYISGCNKQLDASSMPVGSWYHILWTWDGTNVDLYVDGVHTDQEACNNVNNAGATDTFGGSNGVDYLEIYFDEISFWSRVLNSTEINQSYNNGNGCNMKEDCGGALNTALETTLDYPTNESIYYGNYNGSIVLTLSKVNTTATCTLNDTRWTLQQTGGLGNETIEFRNNTRIIGTNISVNYACNDSSGKWSNSTVVFDLDTILDIYVYDEETLTLLDQTITLEIVSDNLNSNYSFTENMSLSSLSAGNYEFVYQSNGYYTRTAYKEIIEGSKNTLTLYLLNSTIGDDLSLELYDEYGNELEDYYIKTMRRINGVYYNVETSKTNFDGESAFAGKVDGPKYYWIIENEDSDILKQSTETTIYDTSTITFYIALGSEIGHIYKRIGGLSYTLEWDNSTKTYTYNYIGGSNTENKIVVYEYLTNTKIAEETSSQENGILTVNLTGLIENGTTYIAKTYMNASPTIYLDSLSVSIPEYPTSLGMKGIFYTILIMILFATMAIWSPPVMLIAEATAFIFTRWMGFHTIPWTYVISIFALFTIIAAVMSDRT